MPEDIHLFTKERRRAIVEWCDKVPVLGFNCGRFDFNLIKEHFAGKPGGLKHGLQARKRTNNKLGAHDF